MKNEFFEITCYIGGPDDKLFISIVNQGIDAHLEAFIKSEFSVESRPPFGHQRRVLNFHRSELPILLRRLRELDNAEASAWADDIETILNEEKERDE